MLSDLYLFTQMTCKFSYSFEPQVYGKFAAETTSWSFIVDLETKVAFHTIKSYMQPVLWSFRQMLYEKDFGTKHYKTSTVKV